MTDSHRQVLEYIALFTDNIGPLSSNPVPEVHENHYAEWLRAVENAKRQWVANAPHDWLDILIDLVKHPASESVLRSLSEAVWGQGQDNRARNAAIIMGLWGQHDPERFFATIGPRIMASPARQTLIAAAGETYLPQVVDCLAPVAKRIDELNEDEIIELIDSIGEVGHNTARKDGDQILARMRTMIRPEFANARREVEVFLKGAQCP